MGLLNLNTNLLISRQGSLLNLKAWYGVRIDEANSSPDLTRISGNTSAMNLHATLPVQSLMKGCLLKDDGTVNYYLDPNDWTKKADGTAANKDGTDGQVMIEVPTYYRITENPSAGVYDHKISLVPIPGWQKVNKFYMGAYEGAVQRSTSKLASVKNTTTDYRGGNNTSAWDALAKTQLGRPATSISLTNFRTYARNRGSNKWNVEIYRNAMLVYELYIIEYATLNSQKAINTNLTAQGYKQGGLGNGVSKANSTEWSNFNSYYPFVPCGHSDTLGNASGEVNYIATDFGGTGINRTFTIPRYRGIEHPFGHIWKWQDGASIFNEAVGGNSKFYTCDVPANFADNTATNYDYRSNLPTSSGYVKHVTHDANGILIPNNSTGGSTTYFCDYFYTPGLINGWRAVLRGGPAPSGAGDGFGSLLTDAAASYSFAYIGARLCLIP